MSYIKISIVQCSTGNIVHSWKHGIPQKLTTRPYISKQKSMLANYLKDMSKGMHNICITLCTSKKYTLITERQIEYCEDHLTKLHAICIGLVHESTYQ